MVSIDQVQLNFSPEGLKAINISLGFIMYGVALSLSPSDFLRLVKQPKSLFVGLSSQFLLLPFLTFLLVLAINPHPSLGLGMMLVAACPGGNISNFISFLAKGNTALSVSMTAIATLFAIVMTPFNITFWGNLNPGTSALLKEVAISPCQMAETVIILLGVPLLLGMLTNRYFPNFTKRILPWTKRLSIVFFGIIVLAACAANFKAFIPYLGITFLLVFLHNALAISGGYLYAKIWGLNLQDRKTISIETGIQNSGLGLILIFNFFSGLGGMALIAAFWGIWHIIAGLSLAKFYSTNIE